jgi:hypothetical protein
LGREPFLVSFKQWQGSNPRSKYDQVSLALATKGKEDPAKQSMEWIGLLKASIGLFRVTTRY